MRSALIPPEGDASMVEPIAAFSALNDNIGVDSTEQEVRYYVLINISELYIFIFYPLLRIIRLCPD